MVLDTSALRPGASYGVMKTDGDGTVPLQSLSVACGWLWRQDSHNPSGKSVLAGVVLGELVSQSKDHGVTHHLHLAALCV